MTQSQFSTDLDVVLVDVGVTLLLLLLNGSLHLLTDDEDLLKEEDVSLAKTREPAGIIRYLERILDAMKNMNDVNNTNQHLNVHARI